MTDTRTTMRPGRQSPQPSPNSWRKRSSIADPFRTTLHTTIVHISDANGCATKWPALEAPTTPIAPECDAPTSSTWSQNCNCPLVWADRESFEVPVGMQVPIANNPKYLAIRYDHASQWALDANLLRRFVHKDEIFWATVYAWGPTGIDDGYAVAEGGQVTVPSVSGVLVNDASGFVGGSLTAVKVSDPFMGRCRWVRMGRLRMFMMGRRRRRIRLRIGRCRVVCWGRWRRCRSR
jgi:hypothetical protein